MTSQPHAAPRTAAEVEALNDRLATEHPIDDYYERSSMIVRWVEGKRLDIIRHFAAVRPGERVLELGSGGGHVLRLFPQGKLVAVDVSDVFLETARRNLTGYDVEFHKGQLAELAFPDGSVDCLICTEVLEHTTDPESILGEIARLIGKNGRAVITVPNDPLINGLKTVVRYSPAALVLGRGINWGGDHFHLHQWWPWQFKKVLEKYFRVSDQRSAPLDRLPLRACFLCRAR